MGIMDLLGRKRENQAMAFVDYEHWFFSLREKFGVKPDVLAWAKEVRDQYDISQMLFFGNLLKESGVTRRLAETARGPLIDTITILLGLTVGASTQASEFLTFDSIKIFALGALSFVIATASGVIFVKIFNLVLPKHKRINPLIGNAGVSAVPDSARISQVVGLEYDPTNYLLMHAMGPNVAGVIGSAVAAGILLGFLM